MPKKSNSNKKGKQSNFAKLSIFQPNKYKFKKNCPLSIKGAPKIDYKNIKLLKKYVSENGKILPSRITNVSQKKQRELSLSIKRARNLALLFAIRKFRANPLLTSIISPIEPIFFKFSSKITFILY